MAVPQRLALDTNVLFDRAKDERFAVDFCEGFKQANFSLEAPETVIIELNYFRVTGTDQEQELAEVALNSLRGWGITPIVLTDIEKTYKKNFITIAQEMGILPPKELNDLHVLAETSIAGIPALVTSDGPLLRVNLSELQEAFNNAGLAFVSLVHPARMVERLRARPRP